MKKLKIIPAILGLCLTLNITGAAVAPELEEEIRGTAGEATDLTDDGITSELEKEIQETMLMYYLSIRKDISAVLEFFTDCLQKNQKICNGEPTFDCNSVATIAQYLTYYIYTLYPRGILIHERQELISFLEMNLAGYGLPPELKNEFFCALESAPVEQSKHFLSPIPVKTCGNAIQILARNPKLSIRYVIDAFKQQLIEPTNKYCSGAGELVRSFTYFVYSLYSRPLKTEDISMLEEMCAKFNSCRVPKESIINLRYAIEHIPAY